MGVGAVVSDGDVVDESSAQVIWLATRMATTTKREYFIGCDARNAGQ